jgi:hypothetical protein
LRGVRVRVGGQREHRVTLAGTGRHAQPASLAAGRP